MRTNRSVGTLHHRDWDEQGAASGYSTTQELLSACFIVLGVSLQSAAVQPAVRLV